MSKQTVAPRPCECNCGEMASPKRRFLPGHGRRKYPHPHKVLRELAETCGPDKCWVWPKEVKRTGKGYTMFSADGKHVWGHRFSYEEFVGPIPEGLVVDHLCRTRDCVNPLHLEPVTVGENVRRGKLGNVTHCKHGHEYTEDNTYRDKRGHRYCRECQRLRNVAKQQKIDANRERQI